MKYSRTMLGVASLLLLAACGTEGTGEAGPAPPRTLGSSGTDSASLEAGEPGRLVVDQPDRDFGEVWQGAVLEHTFAIQSTGSEAAQVVRIHAGCACTVAETWTVGPDGARSEFAEYDSVPVGHTLFVKARLDTDRKVGPLSVDLTLYANVPGARVVLELAADVRPWLAVEPPHVTFERITSDETREAAFVVSSHDGTPFALAVEEDPPSPQLELELVPVDPAGERAASWEVRARLSAGLPRGSWRQRVVFDSGLENESGEPLATGERRRHTAEAWLVGQVVRVVDAFPDRFGLGIVRRGQLSSRTIRIECFEETFELAEPRVVLLDVEGEPHPLAGSFQVSTRPVEDANAWFVDLSLTDPPPDLEGPIAGLVRIETGHPVVYDLDVPFSGTAVAVGRPGG